MVANKEIYLVFSFYPPLLARCIYLHLSLANEDFCSKSSEPQSRLALRIRFFAIYALNVLILLNS